MLDVLEMVKVGGELIRRGFMHLVAKQTNSTQVSPSYRAIRDVDLEICPVYAENTSKLYSKNLLLTYSYNFA